MDGSLALQQSYRPGKLSRDQAGAQGYEWMGLPWTDGYYRRREFLLRRNGGLLRLCLVISFFSSFLAHFAKPALISRHRVLVDLIHLFLLSPDWHHQLIVSIRHWEGAGRYFTNSGRLSFFSVVSFGFGFGFGFAQWQYMLITYAQYAISSCSK